MLFKTYYLNSSVTLESQVGILNRNQFAYWWPCNIAAGPWGNICIFLILHFRISPLNYSYSEGMA